MSVAQHQPRLTEADLDQLEADRLPVPALRLVVNPPAEQAKPLPTPWDVETSHPRITIAVIVGTLAVTLFLSWLADAGVKL
ncbi:MAG: hypothetical protein RJA98_3832 [Pseudomonadota bacterium]|jgi:hypothetical protein